MLIKTFRERMQVSDSRIKPKIDCRLFQMRGIVSVSYVPRVRVTSTEHFAETLKILKHVRRPHPRPLKSLGGVSNGTGTELVLATPRKSVDLARYVLSQKPKTTTPPVSTTCKVSLPFESRTSTCESSGAGQRKGQ